MNVPGAMSPEDVQAELRKIDLRPVIVASHRRSGTHLTIDLIRRQFPACSGWKLPGQRTDWLYLNLDLLGTHHPRMSQAKALRIARRAKRVVIKTHSPQGFSAWRDAYGARPGRRPWIRAMRRRPVLCYAVRDGRAVMVSHHVWRRRFDRRARVPLSEFIRQRDPEQGVSRARAWAEHVRHWRSEEDVELVRFKDTIARPKKTLARLEHAIDEHAAYREPVLPKPSRGRLDSWGFGILGVRPQSTGLGATLSRHTRVPKWWEAFSERDRAFFHEEAGDVLMELGYVESDAWVTDVPAGE